MLHKCKAQGRHKQNKKVGVGLSIFSLLSGTGGSLSSTCSFYFILKIYRLL